MRRSLALKLRSSATKWYVLSAAVGSGNYGLAIIGMLYLGVLPTRVIELAHASISMIF